MDVEKRYLGIMAFWGGWAIRERVMTMEFSGRGYGYIGQVRELSVYSESTNYEFMNPISKDIGYKEHINCIFR